MIDYPQLLDASSKITSLSALRFLYWLAPRVSPTRGELQVTKEDMTEFNSWLKARGAKTCAMSTLYDCLTTLVKGGLLTKQSATVYEAASWYVTEEPCATRMEVTL